MHSIALLRAGPGTADLSDPELISDCKDSLVDKGHVLLRGFRPDLPSFQRLVLALCGRLTFDPAREYSSESTQKVDAGSAAIGLHIENGNTPFPPDIIGFYCKRSANAGPSTTICDGVELLSQMDNTLRRCFSGVMTVSRNLPERLWKQYAANEHPGISDPCEVNGTHLDEILSIMPNQRGTLNDDGSLYYELEFRPVITSEISGRDAFANAILGPSLNYETPVYHFEDGSRITEEQTSQLSELAETLTHEIPWKDGDIVLIDNKRVMHGRRRIEDSKNRQLYIAMGLL